MRHRSPPPMPRRGGKSAADAADLAHHGLTRRQAVADAAAAAETSLYAAERNAPLRRTVDGVLTRQPDFEERRRELEREVMLRGAASGRSLDIAGMRPSAMSAADAAAMRERNPGMYPAPSALRRRAEAGPAAGGGSSAAIGHNSPTGGSTSGSTGKYGYAALRETAMRRAERDAQPAPFMGAIGRWLGGADRLKRVVMIAVVMLMLNARRIVGLVSGSSWDDIIFGYDAGRARKEAAAARKAAEPRAEVVKDDPKSSTTAHAVRPHGPTGTSATVGAPLSAVQSSRDSPQTAGRKTQEDSPLIDEDDAGEL